ncbi:hypothetical protein D3C76_1453540 [compost metagenome]
MIHKEKNPPAFASEVHLPMFSDCMFNMYHQHIMFGIYCKLICYRCCLSIIVPIYINAQRFRYSAQRNICYIINQFNAINIFTVHYYC